MTDFIFSPSENLFFKKSLQYRYELSGIWPDDGIDVDDSIFMEFTGAPPEGKVRGVNNNGYPVWIDIPQPSQEQLVTEAETKKTQFRLAADFEIAWRQDAVDAGIATEKESADLAEWRKYRVLLMRVDAAKPAWPTPPGEQAS